jgi:hypothetical protein
LDLAPLFVQCLPFSPFYIYYNTAAGVSLAVFLSKINKKTTGFSLGSYKFTQGQQKGLYGVAI